MIQSFTEAEEQACFWYNMSFNSIRLNIWFKHSETMSR